LDRALTTGTASILVPSQGAVMLWQTIHSAAMNLSAAVVQSFRRLTARQHSMPADVDAEIQASYSDLVAVTLPKKPAAQKPEKTFQAQAAA
jgi:hypothetical protein